MARASAAAFLEDVAETRVEVASFRDGFLPYSGYEVKEHFEWLKGEVQPDLVLTHRRADAHQDHRLVGSLVRTVWRDALVLHYEIPKWDGDTGAPTHFVTLTEEEALLKVKLLNAHYQSQAGRDWWDDDLFLGLMRVRGIESRSRYAEGFFAPKVLVELAPTQEVHVR